MALEAKIMEMSSYKNEIMILQNEIVKLQVNMHLQFLFKIYLFVDVLACAPSEVHYYF